MPEDEKTKDSQLPLFIEFSGDPADRARVTRRFRRLEEREEKKTEKDRREGLLNDSLAQDIAARRILAAGVFGLIVGWLIFVGVVIYKVARLDPDASIIFNLPESVIIALITTTTINILGLFYIILRYLFPSQN